MNNLIQEVLSELDVGADLEKLKKVMAKKYKLKKFPSNIEILEELSEEQKSVYKNFFITKPVRTLSGVAPLAVMAKPIACKHGKCTFCPGGPSSFFGDVPQSYTGSEPSTMRAIRANYDPYLIVFNRLEQFTLLGQVPEKCEVIIQGGTFCSFPLEYQDEIIKYTFKGMNDFSEMFFIDGDFDFEKFKDFFELPGKVKDADRTKNIHSKLLALKNDCSVEFEHLRNETAMIRSTALVVETKPDWCKEEEINQILRLGATRVELGIQTLKDDVLKITNRGHTMADAIESIRLLKDSFLKVTLHMMPGLPNTSRVEDIEMFKVLFENSDFKPDSLKIYPCLVMQGTPLYVQYRRGEFNPLSTDEAADIIAEGKRFVDVYCRIMRVNRDIPNTVIHDGVMNTNLRQIVAGKVKEKNIKCKCIRCREPMGRIINYDNLEIKKYFYESSGGKECFVSLEDVKNDILVGFVRVRKPFKSFRLEITFSSAGVRELHVYGKSTSLGKEGDIQHRGFGKILMEEAEKVAKEDFKCNKLLVISAVGTRMYYKKLGYSKDGVYMSKLL